ncbi:MAG: nuclear transport factor 2 family protein [Enterococcus sp.]
MLNQQQCIKLYRQQYEAMVNQEIEVLDNLLASEFTLTHMTGIKQSKSEWLNDISRNQMNYFSYLEETVNVTIKQNQAMVVGRNQVDAQIYGTRGKWFLQLELTIELIAGSPKITKSIASTY